MLAHNQLFATYVVLLKWTMHDVHTLCVLCFRHNYTYINKYERVHSYYRMYCATLPTDAGSLVHTWQTCTAAGISLTHACSIYSAIYKYLVLTWREDTRILLTYTSRSISCRGSVCLLTAIAASHVAVLQVQYRSQGNGDRPVLQAHCCVLRYNSVHCGVVRRHLVIKCNVNIYSVTCI
jgi:hypothetical protein